MAQIELPAYGWKPRKFQVEAWIAMTRPDIYREICLAWHRRAGKDEIIMQAIAANAMRRPGNYWHMLPKQDQCRIAIWDSINPSTGRLRWQEVFPPEIIKHVDNSAMQLKFINGSSYQLKGSDNYQNLLSSQPIGIGYSEAALADPAAFDFFSPILLANKGQAIYVSSVRGRNHFYKTYKSLQGKSYAFTSHLSAEDSGVFTPEELQVERERLIARRGEILGNAIFEQEYLSNWDAAVIGAVWAAEIKKLRDQGRVTPCPYDPRYPVTTSWDLGVSRMDPTVILFWQTVGLEERLIDWYVGYELGIDHYASVLREKPYFYVGHIGPHDIGNHEWGYGITRIAAAQRFGIEFTRIPRVKSRFENIGYGKLVLDRCIINVSDTKDPGDIHADCEHVLDALAQYPFKAMPKGHLDADGAGAYAKEPDHEHWTSHYADAVSTYGHFLSMQRDSAKRGLRPQRLQGLNAEPAEYKSSKWDPIVPQRSYRTAASI